MFLPAAKDVDVANNTLVVYGENLTDIELIQLVNKYNSNKYSNWSGGRGPLRDTFKCGQHSKLCETILNNNEIFKYNMFPFGVPRAETLMFID